MLLIPRPLLEQTVGPWYGVEELINSYNPGNGFLYVVLDRGDLESPIKGFFLLIAMPLEKAFMISLLGLDKEFKRQQPDFFRTVLIPWFKAATKLAGLKRLIWSRFKEMKQTRTGQGQLGKLPVYTLEVN